MKKEKDLISKINVLGKNLSKYEKSGDYYIFNSDGVLGIGIECDKKVIICESFNAIDIRDIYLSILGVAHHVVALCQTCTKLTNNFGYLCANFICVEEREKIKTNPLIWYQEWSELLGNVKSKKMIFDIIGEMKTLSILQKKGEHPVWKSTELGTFDITSNEGVYEVKSTQQKTSNLITIHNQYQLNTKNLTRPLYIAFCKLEKNDSGESIETIYNDLINDGFDKNVLDSYLTKLNYYVGKEERYIKYIVHTIRLYNVDKKFPKITEKSFKGGKLPTNIIDYQYSLSLDGLYYTILI